MSNKNLGRGLSAFLDLDAAESISDSKNTIVMVNVDKIFANPFQPRQIFDEKNLQDLSESIKRKGVLQPILVVKSSDGGYQLVAGERRLRASKLAGIKEIPAIVTDISKKDQLEVAILENIQREDLNPIDEAEAYRRLIDEFSHTQEELSEILGKSRSHVTNILRLLTLPIDVKNMLREGKLTFGHARALVGLENAVDVGNLIVNESMNVRQTEDFIKRKRVIPSIKNQKSRNYVDPEALNVAEQIASLVGLNVNIKLKNHGGTVEIYFSNFEELDKLVQRLNKL
jgi:ParB family chromosome partitioning protein